MALYTDEHMGRMRRMWRSTSTFYVAAGIVAVVVIVAIGAGIAALVGGGDGPHAAPAATSPRPMDTDMSIPPALDIRWTAINGQLEAPDGGRLFGPLNHDAQQRAWTFARTPRGALVAAVNISVRSLVGPMWRPTAETQLTGQADYITARTNAGDAPPAGGYCSYVAYHFLSFTTNKAVIELATACPNAVLQSGTATLVWNGDWVLDARAESPQPIESLAGYSPFGYGQPRPTNAG